MRSTLLLISLLSMLAPLWAQTEQVKDVIDLRITEEMVPSGELAIVKIYADRPVALTHANIQLELPPGIQTYDDRILVSGRIFSAFDDAVGLISLDLFTPSSIWVQFYSPRGGVGRIPGMPIAQISLRVKQQFDFTVTGTGHTPPEKWFGPGVSLRFNPGKIRVGGRLAIRSVSPSGLEGPLPAGTTVRILAAGLSPEVRVELEGVRIAAQLTNPDQMEFALPAAMDLAGRRLRLSAPTGEVVEYWLGQGDNSYTVPSPAAASGSTNQPLDFLHARRLVFENPTLSPVVVDVTNAFSDVFVPGEGYPVLPLLSRTIPPGGQWTAGLPTGLSSFKTQGNVPVKVFHFLAGKNGGPYIFTYYGTADPVLDRLARPRIQRIHNAASAELATVSPGQILTLFGTDLGPEPGVGFTLEGGKVPLALGNVKVLLDGVPAPLLYASSGQINFMVPYEVATGRTVSAVVEVNGLRSVAYPLEVTSANPGLFTQSGTGAGSAAALNQDNRVNTQSNPANRGDVVQLYLTGTGRFSPLTATGSVAGEQPSLVALPVRAWIGGVECPVLYAGTSAASVVGLSQVNVRLGRDVPVGDAVPVVVEVDGQKSPSWATLAIR